MKILNKRGQGLSLNVIIVAAIALIVLVLLVMIFTGRIAIFKSGVGEAGDAELIKLKISYGNCHPTTSKETSFRTEMGKATTDSAKDTAIGTLKQEMSRCQAYSTETNCLAATCAWK